MRKFLLCFLVITTLILVGCSKNNAPDNLEGNWIDSEHAERDTYMTASITNDYIEVYWYMDGGETTSLYWAGTFTAPTTAGDYTWDSVNDTEKTNVSLLASGDETKTFSYKNGEIVFELSALGVTRTIHLVRNSD